MRMLDDDNNTPVQRLWLYLTAPEASELLAALRDLKESADQDWHAHVDSKHGVGTGLTVAVYDPANLPADRATAAFLSSGVWSG